MNFGVRPLLGAEALLVPFDPSTGNETHQGHCRAHWTVGRNRFSAMEAPVTHGVCDLSTARPIEVPSANATGEFKRGSVTLGLWKASEQCIRLWSGKNLRPHGRRIPHGRLKNLKSLEGPRRSSDHQV